MAFLTSRDTKEDIEIPVGETTIGRGPFLKITETKVSRNHAIISFDNKKRFQIKPIHKNPTFLSNNSKETAEPLPKDEWSQLQHGDLISLLPDSLHYEVKLKANEQIKTVESLKENFINKDDAVRKNNSSPVKSTQNTPPVSEQPKKVPEQKGPQSDNRKIKSNVQNVQRKRLLPSWMLEAGSSPAKKKEPKKKATKREVPQNKEAKDEHQTQETKKKATKRAVPQNTEIDDEHQTQVLIKKRRIAKENPVKEDNVITDDIPRKQSNEKKIPLETSELLDDVPSAQAASDIKTTKDSPSRNIQDSPLKRSFPSPVKVEPKVDLLSELMGFGSPSITKRPQVLTESESKTEDKQVDSKSKDTGENDEPDSILTQLMGDTKSKKVPIENSEEMKDSQDKKEEEDIVKKTSIDNGASLDNEDAKKDANTKSTLPPCLYGSKCYRRNPLHFKEYSHNDENDENKDNDGDDDEDDDKPECQYGTSCYRSNPQHKRDFKHTKDVIKNPPAKTRKTVPRAAKGKSVLDGDSDDDGDGNTYDYDDSFLDDEEDDDETDCGDNDSDDDDYLPDEAESENLSELVSEAKDFVGSKK